ncbi:zonadhesin-like [Ostrea edulis]|uniref:zonadhesin-like n=1 Tax=Ostrea edulis TaxID=37623 RepID=UPI0024AFA809|nr:zonadhesin-like [Ostrea edulis]
MWRRRRRGRGGKCRCKRGYRGNPRKGGCSASCVCRASGDPHYSTYDGQKIHFMGMCMYTLTRTLGNKPCAFNIMVSNERRNKKKSVSYTKQVDVEIGGIYVTLFKGRKIQVNGTNVDVRKTPYKKNGILLTRVGRRFTKLQSPSCGLSVLWDGKHSVEVTANKGSYGGKMTGICGDCNGKRDDFRLANGTNVSRMPKKVRYRKIGDSYRVPDVRNPSAACEPTPAFSSCSAEQTKRFSSEEACGLMTNTSDGNPFKECVNWMKNIQEADGNSPFSSCLIDACNNDGTGLKQVTCSALEEFEEKCVENGYAPPEKNNWRIITSCALPETQTCGENEEYKEDGSGCPNTCQSPRAENTCGDPDIAGCQCKEGYVREGEKCIPFSRCGCMLYGQYSPQGTSVLSKNCRERLSCRLINRNPTIVKTKTKCRKGAKCKSIKGMGKCEKTDCRRKCGPNAMWRRRRRGRGGKCRCKRGYRGNPRKGGCSASCVCRASGDPHYSTYDGQKIHFMGMCMYTLTRTLGNKPCAFNIMVSNERRNKKKSVSYTKQVDVEIGGIYVTLFKGRKIQVNGTNVDVRKTPYKKNGILLTRVGRRFTKLQSPSCGLSVLWDGKHSVEVTANKGSYGGKMTGICGDCNGKRDDFRLANGTNVSRMPKKVRYRKIGDSYRVPDVRNPSAACEPTPAFSSCSAEQTKRFSSEEACGLMTNTSDGNPFKECVNWMKNTQEADGNSPFSSCLIDACNNDGAGLKQVTCSALEEFEEKCVENGYAPPEKNNWRIITSCALPETQTCGENEEYKEDGSGCPNTCQSPRAENTCGDPDIAGCQCKEGYVREGEKCIPFSRCGCMLYGQYSPQGTSVLSKNCRERLSCRLINRNPTIVKTKTKCRKGAKCKSIKGMGKCEKTDCRRKCGPNAMWRRRRRGRGGKCRCKRGYRGNPRKGGCSASCVCRASGDPHYSTYDGQKIHFMGMCMYTLTRTLGNKPCAFNIMVSNERRNKKKSVSYTKQVDVEIGGIYVTLFKGRKIQVNGTNVDVRKTPYKKNGILLTRVGRRFTKLQSPSCGLSVLWDGKHSVEVTANKGSYGGKMTGICGDCNGKRDDFRLANGTNVSRMPKKVRYRKIGDSYRVPNVRNPSAACEPTPEFSSCSPEQTKRFSSLETCGLMRSTSDGNPFKNCVNWMKNTQEADGNSPFSSCLIDACNNDGAGLKQVTCSALEEFEEKCVENGYAPPEKNNWRNITSCSMLEDEKCQENEEYKEDASGCPNSCLSPKAEETCSNPDIAGCQCQIGYVRDGDVCVPLSQCGCILFNKRFPVSSTILSQDCKERISCTMNDDRPVIIKEAAECGSTEICVKLKGRGVCREVPVITHHAPIITTTPTGSKCGEKYCAHNAECLDNRACVCKDGFYGIGDIKCSSE